MRKQIIIAILLVFFLICSCKNNNMNIIEIPNIEYYSDYSDIGYGTDYLTISSIYRGSDISSRLKIKVLEVKTGKIISYTTHEIPDNNNIFMLSENKNISMYNSRYAEGITPGDNVLINYFVKAEEIYPDKNYKIIDLLLIIHIDKTNGYFIFSVTEITNANNNCLYYENNYFSKETGKRILYKNGTLDNINMFEHFINSFIYEQTTNEKEANYITMLIMNIVNENFW